jgi:polar amino acid transport system substrate-binding protein
MGTTMRSAIARLIGLRGLLYVAIAAGAALGGRASPAAPLRLVLGNNPPFENPRNDAAPGFSVEVLRQVFAAMGQEVSFEDYPWDRSWLMVVRGERDGMFSVLRTSERTRVCAFPDEPTKQERWVFFVRTADAGRRKLSSFDDLVGHDVAVHRQAPTFAEPTASPELLKFLREHHNMVETLGTVASFRMLMAGRVDYAVANLSGGRWFIAELGLRVSPARSSRYCPPT